MLKKIVLIASVVFLVAGCGPDLAPQSIVDTNMTTTRLNAQKNANSYLAAVYPEGTIDAKLNSKPMRILMQSDSTVTKECRFGDGWASGDIQFENGRAIAVKCQTNGTGKGINGCMTKAEFETKNYKAEEGVCQKLESLEKF